MASLVYSASSRTAKGIKKNLSLEKKNNAVEERKKGGRREEEREGGRSKGIEGEEKREKGEKRKIGERQISRYQDFEPQRCKASSVFLSVLGKSHLWMNVRAKTSMGVGTC